MRTKFKIGDKVKTQNRRSGVRNGTGTVTAVSPNNLYTVDIENQGQWSAYGDEMTLIAMKKEDLSDELKKIEAERALLQSKLHWMDTTKAKTYDEKQHKVWEALSILDNPKATKATKVKILSKLLE